MEKLYWYQAEVIRVVDADTVDLRVDLGFSIKVEHRFRIKNYDAPETWRPKSEAELKHGEQATAKAKELLDGKTIQIHTYKDIGIYGRWQCDIELEGIGDYVTYMIENGFEKLKEY